MSNPQFPASILHLFPWSGIIDENQELSNTFRVPDLKTGKMVRLITQLEHKEEEMFRNMIRRLNTLVKVGKLKKSRKRQFLNCFFRLLKIWTSA